MDFVSAGTGSNQSGTLLPIAVYTASRTRNRPAAVLHHDLYRPEFVLHQCQARGLVVSLKRVSSKVDIPLIVASIVAQFRLGNYLVGNSFHYLSIPFANRLWVVQWLILISHPVNATVELHIDRCRVLFGISRHRVGRHCFAPRAASSYLLLFRWANNA